MGVDLSGEGWKERRQGRLLPHRCPGATVQDLGQDSPGGSDGMLIVRREY